MKSAKVKIPGFLKARLKAVVAQHDFASIDALAVHFVDKGLTVYGIAGGELGERIDSAVDAQGYASSAELIEHLLVRGLRAYEEVNDDPERLAERLRGLGYIE